MKTKTIARMWLTGVAVAALLPGTALAQVPQAQTTPPGTTPTGAETPTDGADLQANDAQNGNSNDDTREVLVTGSRIKQDPNNSALPLQIVTTQDLAREGINSPEQLISFLSTNGNGADNLAANSDVTSGAQRGTNGLSAANLRGQGSASTLVLLNGRRVAAHGLTGSAVDVNQIPFAAIDRVEVLKDGASAIYGTDAIGGVINFITKKDFEGLSLQGFTDQTQQGDAPIYRLSATAGYGDLATQGFNIMGAVSKSWNGVLFGKNRDFVNTNQPLRGLSADTRGTPVATAFPINPTAASVGITQTGTLLGAPANNAAAGGTFLPGLVFPGGTVRADGGINILDLPGGAGCESVAGSFAYDEALWNIPGARFACAYDTGRAATLQQPIETLTYYARGTANLGKHQLFAEFTGSDADSAKRFSENQYSANNTSLPIAYPLNALTAATYNDVYGRIAAQFPSIAANYGKPIAFRYRCIDCGVREYTTSTETLRGAIGAEGPLVGSFDYRVGASYAKSQSSSVLGSGFHYRGVFATNGAAVASGTGATLAGQRDPRAPTAPGASAPGIVGLFNSGILNPFSVTQTPAAIAGLEAVSARGVTLYGGKYEVKQFDGSIAGRLFDLPGGAVQIAVGVDYRRETYSFNGSSAAALDQPDIFNAAFDNVNALTPKSRDVKAAYGEISIPIFNELEITAAGRIDEYTGFGTTTNPKVTAKFRPVEWLMFRGSYNTGFRVPTFNQIFNGTLISPNPGNSRADPTTCPAGGVVNVTPGCAAITPDTLTGGNLNLGPETSEQFSGGVVFQPTRRFSASVDFWSIAVDNTIGALTLDQLLSNISFFPDRVARTNGIITGLDLRADNIGSRRTQGLEIMLRGGVDFAGGALTAGLDGTRLLKKREKFLPSQPFGPSLLGVFTYAGDLALKWKHNAFITWSNDNVTLSASQIYRDGYKNNALPASATRPNFNPQVSSYTLYNLSAAYRIAPQFQIALGIRNVLNQDPPFAITYDSNTGAGSSWEPRVADPRGRSFTISTEVRF
ncbi:TonB-dependent receptor domain-containing protein [Sphingomonas sp.]|jgi:iron complex outermembrane receptor protein|uniref:TonB-dependent receptor domain-containing protein n=1 Tax=Sphingomonas sp. TaxID=28214 RepID=UPI002D8073EF|nr:TonB-dependent receptor [Sphingomonas sp.]HEU0045678.1 TonB-dependent receptor [Sphingomonas sp.]